MTRVEQTATAETVSTAAAPPKVGGRLFGPIAVGLAMLSAVATFVVLADLTPIVPTHDVVVSLLLVNAAAVFVLVGIIAREVWRVVQARRTGRAAARLHVRIVALFSIIAAVPAILVAVVASITLDRGLDRLFSAQTQAAIQNSLYVSEAYIRKHAEVLRAETIGMAIDVARAKPLFDKDPNRFQQFLTAQATLRGMPAAKVISREAKVIAEAQTPIKQAFSMPNARAMATVTTQEPQIAVFLESNYVAAVIKLRDYDDHYLYVASRIDPQVVSQLRLTRASVLEYAALQSRRIGVQIAFGLMYTVIALIVLLSAVWIGLNFANYLVAPIRRLIGAANLVSTGNLYVQVPIRRSEGDLAQLGETFNKMTQELRTQRDDIVHARDLIDSRRRFMEAVLAGASAGVIGVDAEGQVSILNRSAEQLIGCNEADALGKPLAEVIPELAEIVDQVVNGGQRLMQSQVTISRNGRERNLLVRVTSEQASSPNRGFVVTLDDITELVAAQRTSAWADVARRIAHEIKNPLTPIQLSAERLRRKYGKTVTDDPAVFLQCTDTIVRQVDDIRRMVDEFSRFARMPKPVIAAADVVDTVRQAVFLMRVGYPDIDSSVDLAEDPMPARFDRRLISQALTNLIKNSAEAIAAVPAEELGNGTIAVSTARDGDDIVIDIVDNGIGLPTENRNRLLEPYVTTREKGTGLGLAIVGRILEDHGGRIELHDASQKNPGQRGAWIRLRFASEAEETVEHPEPIKALNEQ